MPTISSFYGITISMRPKGKEHNPPHIHAKMQRSMVSVSIETGEIMEGSFPPKGRQMVKEFVLLHKEELMEMWETGEYKTIEPLL